jgi:guanylate kinase
MAGQLFVISGPSGAGKSSIISKLKDRLPCLGYSVSHTTRAPRRDETGGRAYHFVDRETFQEMIRENRFVEWAEVYGDLYGTSFVSLNSQLNKGFDVLLDVDNVGAGNIRKHYPKSVLVYICPPSLLVLEQRLRNRATEDREAFKERYDKALKELSHCASYDYLVLNDDLEDAVDELAGIIIAQRCMTSRRLPKIRTALDLPS